MRRSWTLKARLHGVEPILSVHFPSARMCFERVWYIAPRKLLTMIRSLDLVQSFIESEGKKEKRTVAWRRRRRRRSETIDRSIDKKFGLAVNELKLLPVRASKEYKVQEESRRLRNSWTVSQRLRITKDKVWTMVVEGLCAQKNAQATRYAF